MSDTDVIEIEVTPPPNIEVEIVPPPEIELEIQNLQGFQGIFIVVSPTPPERTDVLWIDTGSS
jgi:hypothetical protein